MNRSWGSLKYGLGWGCVIAAVQLLFPDLSGWRLIVAAAMLGLALLLIVDVLVEDNRR